MLGVLTMNKDILLYALLHFLMLISLMVINYGNTETIFGEKGSIYLQGLLDVLGQPAFFVWEKWGKNVSDRWEWGLIMLNSLLWGGAVVYITRGCWNLYNRIFRANV